MEREKQVLENPCLKHHTHRFPQQVQKRIGVRTDQWHELLTKGAISKSQYEELKGAVARKRKHALLNGTGREMPIHGCAHAMRARITYIPMTFT